MRAAVALSLAERLASQHAASTGDPHCRGLPAAVRSLVDRAPVPVSLDVVEGRHPEPVESAAYFVVSEVLANIAKHAHAGSASVSIHRDNGTLVVQVHDDGRGGADSRSGSGLLGRSSRCAQRNPGRHQPGAGTTIRAEIPCAS